MTIIVADTTCGLPRNLLAERGIPLIPQVVVFGEESYHDDKDLDTAAFLEKLKAAKTLPKTAAPEPPLYYPVLEEARRKKESIIVVAPTGKASGTVRSAQVIMDRETGRSKGFGFVEMDNAEEARAAITNVNGREFNGRALTVNEARPREARSGGGGGGFGGGGGAGRRREPRW